MAVCPTCCLVKSVNHQNFCFKCEDCGLYGYGSRHYKICKAKPPASPENERETYTVLETKSEKWLQKAVEKQGNPLINK